jgi:hypothetical protein
MAAFRCSVTLFALSLTALAAAAQDSRPRPPRPDGFGSPARPLPPHAYYRGEPRQVCVPWCAADSNPCDPPVFKQADGRCMRDDD